MASSRLRLRELVARRSLHLSHVLNTSVVGKGDLQEVQVRVVGVGLVGTNLAGFVVEILVLTWFGDMGGGPMSGYSGVTKKKCHHHVSVTMRRRLCVSTCKSAQIHRQIWC